MKYMYFVVLLAICSISLTVLYWLLRDVNFAEIWVHKHNVMKINKEKYCMNNDLGRMYNNTSCIGLEITVSLLITYNLRSMSHCTCLTNPLILAGFFGYVTYLLIVWSIYCPILPHAHARKQFWKKPPYIVYIYHSRVQLGRYFPCGHT